jgi:hypothetical protein
MAYIMVIKLDRKEGEANTNLTSPVKAPPFLTQQFWAATWISGRRLALTVGRKTYGGLTTVSAAMTVTKQ